MSSLQNQTPDDEFPPLPPRRFFGNPEWAASAAMSCGYDLDNNARTLSATEWMLDMVLSKKMKEEFSLDEIQEARLVQRFRERNQKVWGQYCEVD